MASNVSPQLVFDTLNAFQRSAALKTAIELDLFTAVATGHDRAGALASACGAAERGVRILADFLVVIGLLTKSEDRWGLTPDSAMFLDRRSPAYLGRSVEFIGSDDHRRRFANLTDIVRSGGAPADDESVLVPEHDVWVNFARAMTGVMAMPAELLAQRVVADNPSAIKVLDIAAGHGLFGISVARHNARATIVAVDWPNVLSVATENARQAGVHARHQTLPGSAFDVDFGGGYDVVLLTNFLHHFDRPAIDSVMRKVHAALKPGGRAYVLEFVPNADRVTPPTSAGFALVMLATTPAGDAYTFAEYEQMFSAAGFALSECSNLEPTMQQLIVAQR
ncbi:MAG TPA: class I SAM-dependent methyltransferase [Pirellulales bacterium]|jgi:ubiquinone/menaquinone biosynthesis C-methylase UbiE|nr:class I SAM-dependent methyltransferase [Pirellulales bacterium]